MTYIDGDEGKLWYRGYPIQDVASSFDYIETLYLLFFGEKPSKAEREDMESCIMSHFDVDQKVKNVIEALGRDAHPMALLSVATSALTAMHEKDWNVGDRTLYRGYLLQTFAKFIAVIPYIFRYISGLDFVQSKSKNLVENFSETMFAGFDILNHKEALMRAINRLLILHADHEQNASTSATRLVVSTDVNPYSAILSGVSALWGPLHGGANEAVLIMLEKIGNKANIPSYIEDVKAKKVKLMGFGHRVYKNYDPRAAIIKSSCDEILAIAGSRGGDLRDLLLTAQELESIALHDEYFTSRKLFPNVDFYSGIIYRALDIPVPFFTAMFAAGRIAGWVSHINEFLFDSEKRIARPRQLYIGKNERHL